MTKNYEKSNRKKILPASWRSQTPSKTPSMHPPDQAKHNKSSLDANGRLEVIFCDVLCSAIKKNRPLGGLTDSSSRKCRAGTCSGKSRQIDSKIMCRQKKNPHISFLHAHIPIGTYIIHHIVGIRQRVPGTRTRVPGYPGTVPGYCVGPQLSSSYMGTRVPGVLLYLLVLKYP